MNTELLEFLMNSPYAGWVMFLSAVVFTLGSFVAILKLVASVNKLVTSEPIQNVLAYIEHKLRRTGQIFLKYTTFDNGEQSLRSKLFGKGFEMTGSSFFAAMMYLYGLCILLLAVTSQLPLKNMAALFALGLVLLFIGRVYHYFARKALTDFNNLKLAS